MRDSIVLATIFIQVLIVVAAFYSNACAKATGWHIEQADLWRSSPQQARERAQNPPWHVRLHARVARALGS